MKNDDNTQPEQIGPYRIRAQLGEGGMAIVYLAEQSDPVKRHVALKILKSGMDSKQIIARFDSERQALAVLEHPNIAKIFDGGITSGGRPYFAMEYVDGLPITEFCDTHRLNTEARLKLFIRVCRAVQHAHLKGLIHRDLKPSNILVGIVDNEPQPLVIDFGIAKATEEAQAEATQVTRIGQFVGTPHYMSPEQTGSTDGDIDTRSDIYSLGVLLYELLVGTLPIDLTTVRDIVIANVIQEKIPPRPSARYTSMGETRDEVASTRDTNPQQLSRQLKGDLDWIVMQAIEKDRERRYQTANALADDCERYLNRQPIVARPPSAGYLLSRFVRRNRAAVAGVSIAFVAVLIGAIAATVGFLRATEAELEALREAETSRQVSEFLVGLFEISDPSESRGNSITAREVLDTAVAKVDDELVSEPEIRSRLMNTMAQVYGNLGLYRDALPIAETAVDVRRTAAPNSILLADSLDRLGEIKSNLGDPDAAAELHQEARSIRESLNLQATSGFVATLQHQSVAAYLQSDFELARTLMTSALQHAESMEEEDTALIAEVTGNLGVVYHEFGDMKNAEVYKRRAVDSFDQLYGPIHPKSATARNNLALTLNRQQQFAAAAAVYRESLDAYRQLYPEGHPNTANAINNLAQVLVNLGRIDEAERLQRESLAMFEDIFGPEHSQVGTAAVNLGRILTNNEQVEEAELLLRRAVAMQTKLHPAEHIRVFLAEEALSAALNALGEFDEALELATNAHNHFDDRYGPEHWRTARSSSIMADALIGLREYDRAEQLLIEAIPRVEAGLGIANPATIAALRSLLSLYEKTGRAGLAAEYRARFEAIRADWLSSAPHNNSQGNP